MSAYASESREYKVAVVGPGAVGTVIAYSLNKSGVKPYLVFKTATKARKVAARGVKILINDSVSNVNAVPVPYSQLGSNSIDTAFLTVKAYDTVAAVKSLKPALRAKATIVICQNGLGVVNRVREVLGEGFKYVRAVLNLGAFRRGDGIVKLAGVGESYVGSVDADRSVTEEVAEALKALNTRPVDDIWRYVWLKLAVNAGINPLTALLRITNGELLRIRPALTVAVDAALEVDYLARRKGITLPKDPAAELVRVAEATSSNVSSMLQDILAGRRTEVDFINGAVCLEGLKEGVVQSVNCTLWALIKSLEDKRSWGNAILPSTAESK